MSNETATVTRGDIGGSHDILSGFVADCQLRGMTGDTLRSYRSNVGLFLDFLRSRKVDLVHVQIDELRLFLADLREKNLSGSTIANYFAAISTFYEFLIIEKLAENNPVISFRKRYLRGLDREKRRRSESRRKLLTVEEMSSLIKSVINIRDKAILVLLAKTGLRRSELLTLDVDDIIWENQSIRLKPKAKRSSLIAFFDDETARILQMWISVRETQTQKNEYALFIGDRGRRMGRNTLYKIVTEAAELVGLHDPDSPHIEDHFSPHCFRHWFTTWLLRNGMPREYVKELRGDARSTDAIDVYYHIDRDDLRNSYLACIPELYL